MSENPIRVLVVEDNPGDARLVREALASPVGPAFEVEWLDRLERALERLHRPDIDVVLLDLSLPDAAGAETIDRVNRQAPHVPIIVLSGLNDENLIQDAVKRGAEDYLVKTSFSPDLMARSIRYAIDRKRAMEELEQNRDSALESARLRSEFLANMSHEIRTPLNGMIGMTRLLLNTKLSNDQREMLQIARVSADALLKIVNDILDFSKISAGKVALEEADFDLGTAVESVLALFAEQAQSKGVELASYIDNDVPVLLRGDAGRICQVLTNLIGNAVKFTHEGEVTVRVGLVNESDSGAMVRFTVKDTGIGMPLEGQRHIFQAFAQGDGSTTRMYGGTGLGLAISAQLVELMGGNIGVQSEQGGGSTFWFTAAMLKQAAPERMRENASGILTGVRMLVADHGATAARIARDHASAWAMRCDSVTSAAETLIALKDAAAANDPYGIALIEMQLPGMEGIALARAIKSDPTVASTQIIGMYSLGGRPDDKQARAAGLRALLVKPLKQSQLFNSLSVALAARRAAAAPDHAAVMHAPPEVRRRRPVREITSRVPAAQREKLRLLMVEDNVVNQQVQLRMLSLMGYHPEVAENGRVALERHRDAVYDLILMDCQMPEMDGYAATREIRRRERGPHRSIIIGVTAHALTGDREECLDCGMDDYIAKPIVPEDLAAILDKWVLSIGAVEAGTAAPEPRERAPRTTDEVVLDASVLAELRETQTLGEDNFLPNLIAMFQADLAERLIALRRALAAGDSDQISQHAHALKGSASELGARRMRAICERIELRARGGAVAGMQPMLRELEGEAELVRAALANEGLRPNL
jgi:signal transduction histidine kinase/HPt (histidine-containing phosphotransfer) domain-containing protein